MLLGRCDLFAELGLSLGLPPHYEVWVRAGNHLRFYHFISNPDTSKSAMQQCMVMV